MNIPFRTDEYGKSFYIENKNGFTLLPYKVGEYSANGIDFFVSEKINGDILKISLSIKSDNPIKLKRL